MVRCYQTRHGPGPFVTEDRSLELPEPHNAAGAWQGEFRAGHFDVLAFTHLDTAARRPELRVCRGYDIDGEKVTRLDVRPAGDLAAQEALTRRLLRARPVYDGAGGDWPQAAADALGVPVFLASHGPRALDKRVLGVASCC